VIATANPEAFGMPASRRHSIRALAIALAEGELTIDPGSDRGDVERRLLALPGVGPWTAAYIAMRALGDPDAWMPTDLGIRHALQSAGLPADPASATRLADRWRPWRSYALQYLWASLDGAAVANAAADRPFSHPLERSA
jgi:AraC family transcriptional regulator of adaptative response / DNA-3-methyladenine glycosylase II